jgi:hypothetical protein
MSITSPSWSTACQKILPLALDGHEEFVQVPCVAQASSRRVHAFWANPYYFPETERLAVEFFRGHLKVAK